MAVVRVSGKEVRDRKGVERERGVRRVEGERGSRRVEVERGVRRVRSRLSLPRERQRVAHEGRSEGRLSRGEWREST